MSKKALPLILLALAALTVASPAPLHAIELKDAQLAPTALQAGMTAIPPRLSADLDGDASMETLLPAEGRLEIRSAGRIAWQSPPGWEVLQAEFTDLDHDGRPEVTLLVWRPFRPWPVDRWLPNGGRIAAFQDANGYSCHIIMIGWLNGVFRELWAGSAMAEPVKSFFAADLNADGAQELVTVESDYSAPRSDPGNGLKIWEWNGFGFSFVSKMGGTVSKAAPVRTNDGRVLILVP